MALATSALITALALYARNKGETVNLDKQIDCIYYDETFYVIKKVNFEQIVGLQEEYKEQSKIVVNELRETGKI